MATVNMLEAKTNLSKLVQAIESGREQEIVLARNGKPVARIIALAPARSKASKRLGFGRGQFGNITPEALADWDREWDERWPSLIAEPATKARIRRKRSA